MMQMVEQYLTMADGHEIFTRICTPTDEIRGHVHILHGMAEHCRRYDAFANFLCGYGYVVSMHDHRGHGLTAERNGILGFIAPNKGFDVLVNDALEVIVKLRGGQDWPKPFLLGHSMGSFVARRFIQLFSYSVQGVILSGTSMTKPLHRLGQVVSTTMAIATGKETPSKFLDQMSFGSFNKSVANAKTDFDWLCSDEAEVQKYVDDPHCGFICSTQLFNDLTTGLSTIMKKTELSLMRRDLPVLFLSGADDPVADFGKGTFQVAHQFTAIGMKDVTVHVFEHMRHEILNEKQHDQVYAAILRWLEKYDKAKY